MWGFGQVSNQSKEDLWIDYVIGAGASSSGGQLNGACGNAEIDVGTLGAIYFTDIGHCEGYPHYWCVQVNWEDQQTVWSYDGGGSLDVQVNDDGSFVLSGQGQTIPGKFTSAPGPGSLVGRPATAKSG